jgi:hypothetical protein
MQNISCFLESMLRKFEVLIFFLKCYLPSLKVFANSVMFLNPLLALKSRQPRRSRHETNHIQTCKSRSSKSKQMKIVT